jgi:hypothetical protein
MAAGKPHIVPFSSAKGDKVRFISNENCAAIMHYEVLHSHMTEFHSLVEYSIHQSY